MTVDIIGKEPNNEEGRWFGRNNVTWSVIGLYILDVVPTDITAKVKHWFTNDGDGLDKDFSLWLANYLREELESGRTKEYFMKEEDNTPKLLKIRLSNITQFCEFLENCGGFEIW